VIAKPWLVIVVGTREPYLPPSSSFFDFLSYYQIALCLPPIYWKIQSPYGEEEIDPQFPVLSTVLNRPIASNISGIARPMSPDSHYGVWLTMPDRSQVMRSISNSIQFLQAPVSIKTKDGSSSMGSDNEMKDVKEKMMMKNLKIMVRVVRNSNKWLLMNEAMDVD